MARASHTKPAPRRGSSPAKAAAAKPTSSPRPAPSPERIAARRDLGALGAIAVGAWFAFLLYARVDGGTLGQLSVEGLAAVIGVGRYAAPPVLFGLGAALLLDHPVLTFRPLHVALLTVVPAVLLLLATGVVGPADPPRAGGLVDLAWARSHGGVLGDLLAAALRAGLGSVGVKIVAVALTVAGVLLLTGASAGLLVRRGGDHVRRGLSGVRAAQWSLARRLETRGGPAAPLVAVGSPVPAPPAFLGDAAGDPDALPAAPVDFVGEARTFDPLHPGAAGDDEAGDGDDTDRHAAPLDGASAFPDLFDGTTSSPFSPGAPAATRPATAASARVAPVGPDAAPTTVWSGDPPEPDDDPEADTASSPAASPAPAAPAPTARRTAAYRIPNPRHLRKSVQRSGQPVQDVPKVSAQLVESLRHFGVESRVVGTVCGPRVTRYELQMAPGVKMSKVANLGDDLRYALAATDIRILAPIPGKQAVGIEVPNPTANLVTLGDIWSPVAAGSPLVVWLGKDIAGHPVHADLARMPHLLIAGTTGSGKSASLNAMLTSILLRSTPEQVRLILIDPKKVELNHYEDIPHLLTPVVTSPKRANAVLQNIVAEMEHRYEQMGSVKARQLPELNDHRTARGLAPLPWILVVIDELADLMMVAPADVEDSIIRLAQKSRAVGIHLLLATQRPSVDVITGMIKANVPSRIAFAVSSGTDSRVILDTQGAETLLGQGDMLYRPIGTSRLQRLQGAYITEEEILAVTDACRGQGEPDYEEELLADPPERAADGDDGDDDELDPDQDDLLADAIGLVAQLQTASVSVIQRRLRVGYTRAGRLIDMLERRGVVSGYEGSKPRTVLIAERDLPRILAAVGRPDPAREPVQATLAELETS